MSSGRQGKTTNWADDTIGTKLTDERQAMWGEIPGEVVSFDSEKQTATIKPLYKPKFNGKPVDMPELLEVPVRFARAGNGAMTYPVKAGDKVNLRPQMRSSENYHEENDGSASDARSFNLSDMEAFLDGGESLQDPIPNFDNANTHVRFDPEGQYGIRGSTDGKVKIEGSEGNIYDLLATVVELLSTDALLINYGSSAGTGHELQHRAQYLEIAGKLEGDGAMIGLALDPTTNDLYVASDNSLAVVRDAHAIGQHVRQRLKTFRGEWFLDTTAGMPWLDQIMGRAFDPSLAEAIVKAEILDTLGVTEITSFSVGFDREYRRLNIRGIEVLTTYDLEIAV